MVAVVGGAMSIQGDGNTAHKAKDHSRDDPAKSDLQRRAGGFLEAGDEPTRDGEPDALKDACPVREGLH